MRNSRHVLARNQGLTAVLLLSMLMAATTVVGIAALRAIRPLISEHDDRSAVIGQRTRAALEQEKANTLRTIKELEFDARDGKMSEADFTEMSVRLRARAQRLMKQLDAGTGYRPKIRAGSRKAARRRSRPAVAERAAHLFALFHFQRRGRALLQELRGAAGMIGGP
jgi:hypothetical protein